MRPGATEFAVRLNFHESLRFFLHKKSNGSLGKILREKTSVKDVIESCGVPHPEVDLILIVQAPVDFSFRLEREHEIEIFGIHDVPTNRPNHRIQSRDIRCFVADGHLGKLVRFLRLLGIDVAYDHTADDRTLVELAAREKRALLTRDRRLLMHSIVEHGYYPRSQFPEKQATEVARRFELSATVTPYTRCLHCNTLLDSVRKSDVLSQLEPLTRIYYEDFRRCSGCGKVYWAGSHFPKLQARVARLTSGR